MHANLRALSAFRWSIPRVCGITHTQHTNTHDGCGAALSRAAPRMAKAMCGPEHPQRMPKGMRRQKSPAAMKAAMQIASQSDAHTRIRTHMHRCAHTSTHARTHAQNEDSQDSFQVPEEGVGGRSKRRQQLHYRYSTGCPRGGRSRREGPRICK